MPIRLRISLQGRRNHRIFHLVAIDQRKARDARPAELLGIYDPRVKAGENVKTIQWSVDRIRYWLHVGAQPSKRFVKLLELGGILQEGHPYKSGSPVHNFLPSSQELTSTTPADENATPSLQNGQDNSGALEHNPPPSPPDSPFAAAIHKDEGKVNPP